MCLVVLLTSKMKPLSGDTPQKTHFATGSLASVAVDLRGDMVIARGKTPRQDRGPTARFVKRSVSRVGRPPIKVAARSPLTYCNNLPDAFARQCGWHLGTNHPPNPHTTRGPVDSPRTVIGASRGSHPTLREPRTHSSSHTRSKSVAARPVHQCRILRTRARGARGVHILWKLWKVQRRSRYLGSTRLPRPGTSSGFMMQFIPTNGGRCVIPLSNA